MRAPRALLAALAIVAVSLLPASDFQEGLKRAAQLGGAGKYSEALREFTRLVDEAAAAGEVRLQAKALRERGVCYLHHNAFDDARADFERAIALLSADGDAVGAARVRLRLASMTIDADPQAALEIVLEVERTMRTLDEPRLLREAQLYRARVELLSGDYPAALATLAPLREFHAGDLSKTTDVLNLEAYALQHSGSLEQARDSYRELIEVAFKTGNQRIVAYAFCNLGDVEAGLGQPRVAEESLDRSIELLDRIRGSLPGGVDERTTFMDAQVLAYDRKIGLLLDEHKDATAAFHVAEGFHAKTLLEEMRSPSAALDTEALTDEERALFLALIGAQQRMIAGDSGSAEGDELAALERDWERTRRRALRRENEATPRIELRTEQAIGARLPKSSAMLSYWMQPERTLLWILRGGRVDLIQIPVERAALIERIERYVAPIRDRVRAEDIELRGQSLEHLAVGRELYDLLVAPALSRLEGVEQLIVVPDDYLWYLPFETLVRDLTQVEREPDTWFSEYAGARYLLHEFSLLYAPSASVWYELAERESGGEGLLAIAPSVDDSAAARERGLLLAPLPGALEEALGVASRVLAGQAMVGADASEMRVKELLSRYRFVHFATHGYLHRDRPQLSGLVLWPGSSISSGAQPEDGLFQGFEVQRLPLKAELVSLASCNSGLGQLSRAEGVLGVARSFLVAGARNVLVSLWPVDDRASRLLIDGFYDELLRQAPLPRALREAKLKLMQTTTLQSVVADEERLSYAHPYFWSTYVLVGGDAMQRPPLAARATSP